jgi:hypothetical protein
VRNDRKQRTVLSPTNWADIRLQYIMVLSAQGVSSTVFSDSSGGEEHDTSQTPTSQFGEVPRSMGRDNFTVKSA